MAYPVIIRIVLYLFYPRDHPFLKPTTNPLIINTCNHEDPYEYLKDKWCCLCFQPINYHYLYPDEYHTLRCTDKKVNQIYPDFSQPSNLHPPHQRLVHSYCLVKYIETNIHVYPLPCPVGNHPLLISRFDAMQNAILKHGEDRALIQWLTLMATRTFIRQLYPAMLYHRNVKQMYEALVEQAQKLYEEKGIVRHVQKQVDFEYPHKEDVAPPFPQCDKCGQVMPEWWKNGCLACSKSISVMNTRSGLSKSK